jgi:hypothetical protein
MDNRELFQRVKDLNLPRGEYAIFGSGPMGVRGIREMKDVDIIVTHKLWDDFVGRPGWELRQIDDLQGMTNHELNIEMWKDWWIGWDVDQMINEADIFDELPFVKLEMMIEWKTLVARDKDLIDLKLIEDWQKGQVRYEQELSWYKNDYLDQDWEKEESAHYIFHFAKASLAEKDIKRIMDLKEKHHAKIIDWLEVGNERKMDYYLYPSIKEKKALMGDDSPGNAIWERLDERFIPKKFEIHVVYSDKCKFVGEHEDVHLLSLPWGLSVYLFCEGLAQSMEDSFMGEDLHHIAKSLSDENRFYSLEWLCDNKNWENVEPVIIYPQAGSFAKFLIEYYGKDKFKEVYRNTSRNADLADNLSAIVKVYQRDIKQLEKEWINLIKNYEKS